jgi:hypothetical protein
VLLQPDLTPTFPSEWRDPAGNEPMELVKVDDYTINMTFGRSYGLLMMILAGPTGANMAQRYAALGA